jgi:dTDP-4-dehydrorhamnose reductase
MMRILVTGSTGQLGFEVLGAFSQSGHEIIAPVRRELDFLSPKQVADRVRHIQPDWVINCAAYTQVDRAESEMEPAFVINRDSASQLAEAVAGYGGQLLHVSTDFIFDGTQSRPYREEDEAQPLGVYGRSKWEGEEAIRAALPGALILRTAWVYGVHGHNFVKTILRVATEGKPLRVVNDQIGSPTWARDIAGAIRALVQNRASGTYHYTNAGSTSWHGFATSILAGATEAGFILKTNTVEAIPTSGYPTPARRPAYSVLDTGKIQSLLTAPIPHWRDSLDRMLKELQACADCW